MSRAASRRFFRHGLLPQLLVFETVARLGSVTRAAEELHLAQPTVSLQLKKLGETLEVALFEQRGRRLHLTGAGQTLRGTCTELIQCLARADASLAPWRQPKRETLLLAAEPESRAAAARLLFREALRLDAGPGAANNAAATQEEQGQWKSPGNTTPQ